MTLKLPMLSHILSQKALPWLRLHDLLLNGALSMDFFLKNGELKETVFPGNCLIFALCKIEQNLNVIVLTLIFF